MNAGLAVTWTEKKPHHEPQYCNTVELYPPKGVDFGIEGEEILVDSNS